LIRTARPADEPLLRELDRLTWSTLHSPAPAPPADRPFELDGVLVAELADGLAGYVKVGQAVPLRSSEHILEIKGLSVDPGYRRRGVGKALIHAALGQARAAGARRLMLRVLAHNTGARELYAQCGFEVEGVHRELFLLDGRYVDDIWMARSLD
jgi:ribosomal protein S18 acetylase RimI-like enzyme